MRVDSCSITIYPREMDNLLIVPFGKSLYIIQSFLLYRIISLIIIITKTISHPPLNGSSESFNDIIKASYEELGVGTTHLLKVYAGNVIGTSLVKSYSFTVPNTQRTSNNIQLLIYYYYFYYYYYLLQITKSPKVLHNQSFNVMLLLLLLLLLLFVCLFNWCNSCRYSGTISYHSIYTNRNRPPSLLIG